MTIPVETKDMKFKYICKYCQKSGLAWKVIDHKWVLFEDHSTHHTCDEKKDKLSNQVSNLKKEKVHKKKSPLKKLLDEKTLDLKAKKILEEIKMNVKDPVLGIDITKGDLGAPLSPIDSLFDKTKSVKISVDLSKGAGKTNPKSNASKVKLKDAEELYQPVYGSSQNSTYYVVALYDGLKFAARVKGGGQTRTVSIRVEGDAYPHLKGMSGLQKFKDNGAYGSIHLNVETVYEAKMVICGLIGGLDLESKSPLPDLTNIAQ